MNVLAPGSKTKIERVNIELTPSEAADLLAFLAETTFTPNDIGYAVYSTIRDALEATTGHRNFLEEV